MIQSNIDLSLKVFDSSLKFIVTDDKVVIKLDKDLKLRLNFDTNTNSIILENPVENDNEVYKYVEEVKENDVEEVKEVEDNQNGSDINFTTTEEPTKEDKVEETKDETYWDNGVLKHRNEKVVEPEEQECAPTDITILPKSAKRGRPNKQLLCIRCGEPMIKEGCFTIGGKNVCSKCATKLKEQMKRDVLRLKERKAEYDE